MKIVKFNISYHAEKDCTMQIVCKLSGAAEQELIIEMQSVDTAFWCASLELAPDVTAIEYGYRLMRAGKVARNEWAVTPHKLSINCVNNSYYVCDMWLDSPVGNYTQTNLFRFFSAQPSLAESPRINWYNRSLTLTLYAMGIGEGESLAVCGDAPLLGAWEPSAAPLLQQVEPNLWSVTLDIENLCDGNIHFKFIKIDKDGKVQWEEGENRNFLLLVLREDAASHSFTLPHAIFPSPEIRLAGTVIPLFSIRSHKGWGVGDFGDIKLMAEWLRATGQNILQLLPLNDTTIFGGDEDSYPYNCVSVYALNPIYMDMSALPRLASDKANNYYEAHRKKLNEAPAVNYSLVYALKMKYLRDLFAEQGSELLASEGCRLFIEEQKRWLKPYALFRYLTKRLHSCIWDWGKYRYYDDNTEAALLAEYPDAAREIEFYMLVQYILHKQLSEAHDYANSIGVALKGDIPIGVAPNGVDVWCEREQFNLEVSAGAPPDMFAADGQNWGFPTYNWDIMEKDGYAWWRRRLQYMSHFFDAYRIDHVLGFFRIWEIPHTAISGLSGSFSPNRPYSVEELATAGFAIEEQHLRPYITKELLKELFPRRVKYIVERFLDEAPDGTYCFKQHIGGASALAYEIYDKCGPKFPEQMKKALLRLFGSVLFLRDLKEPDKFVPRILGGDTEAYRQLPQPLRIAYDRIYEEYFYNRHTMHWFEEGMRKLAPVLQSTTMTACGEDLGMIPACVPWVMKNLQILSLEIQRMPKLYGETFARPECYPYLSVATPSTHDMSTLRGWWREDEALSAQFYNQVLGCCGEAPKEMSGTIARAIIAQHLQSPAAFALFAWQDLMAMDERLRLSDPDAERINVPSNRDHLWNYRMHIAVEDMMNERAFNENLLAMITDSGRGA